MLKKQTALLFLAAVSSSIVYSEASASTIVQEEAFYVAPGYSEQSVIQPRATMFAVSEPPVITTFDELKVLMSQGLANYEQAIQVQYKGSTATLMEDVMAYLKQEINNDDYLLGIVLSYGVSIDGFVNDAVVTISLDFTTNAEQEKVVHQEVKRLVATLIRPTMSEVEKVKVINDYIVKNTTYTYDSTTSPHAAYAIITEGKGVCQAYAMLAYLMLEEAGFEVRYVTGFAREPHAWNLVKVDGEWYHLDTTWNDPVFNFQDAKIADYISYNYFLLSDQAIEKDHTIDYRPGLPAATSNRFNALQNNLSLALRLNGMQFYLVPQAINDDLYYVAADLNRNSYPIHRISYTAANPVTEAFANVQAMEILAANDSLYFIDVETNFGLSKLNVITKKVEKLYRGNQPITRLKKDEHFVYAYSDNTLVHQEELQVELDGNIAQIESLSKNIVFLTKDFASNAEQLLAMVDALGDESKLSAEARSTIALVRTKLAQMQNLTFNQTTAWKENTTVREAQKSWVVKLSQTINNTPNNLQNVRVVDMFGEEIAVSITIEDGKTIRVTPKENYIAGIPYTLVINANLETEQGKKLGKGTHLTFTFE